MDKLIARRAIGRDHAAQGADFADVPDQRAGINIPNRGNSVAVQIKLGGFGRAPVRRELRKFTNDEGLDVRTRGFFVIEVGADVPDVRIGEADDLPGITWIGENFLVTGETGVENDFPTAARDGAGGAAVKYAPVFESEYRWSVLNFGQRILPCWSSACASYLVFASVEESEPKWSTGQ
jgi:hypothetical protein